MSDPAALAAAFTRIAATRMADLPLNNPVLTVEAVGFRKWQGKDLGALVLPWALNLVLLPGDDPEFIALAADRRQHWRFPSGGYDFMGGDEPECGPFQFCSLFSPAHEFADQAAARATAEAALDELFRAAPDAAATAREEARLTGLPVSKVGLSRRDFFSAFCLRG